MPAMTVLRREVLSYQVFPASLIAGMTFLAQQQEEQQRETGKTIITTHLHVRLPRVRLSVA